MVLGKRVEKWIEIEIEIDEEMAEVVSSMLSKERKAELPWKSSLIKCGHWVK